MLSNPIVITGAARTPIGGFLGELKETTAPRLGAVAISAALERGGVQPHEVDEVIMGCVLPAGIGQAPARQASLFAGIPDDVGCTTVNKMCGSGMKAIMLAHDALAAGSDGIAVAGGFESMSRAPYLLDRGREGYRMGNAPLIDHMYMDGLADGFGDGRLMGCFAEECATAYEFSRAQQDDFAIASLQRAQQASADGTFAREIAPVTVKTRGGEEQVSLDEQPRRARLDRIPTLRPAFDPNGTVTAANSSSISDGAAAVVMMSLSEAMARGAAPDGAVVAHASHAQKPALFTTAPVGAIQKVLDKAGWSVKDVDLFEVNEAFAVVPMAAMFDLGIPHERLNIHGGACALGHPVGASGARIVVTLLNALQKYDLKRGVAALCIGGGEATAIAVERLN
jgi:acetyl-CoA C-acetyltransferase